jgi:hypothetical protein
MGGQETVEVILTQAAPTLLQLLLNWATELEYETLGKYESRLKWLKREAKVQKLRVSLSAMLSSTFTQKT